MWNECDLWQGNQLTWKINMDETRTSTRKITITFFVCDIIVHLSFFPVLHTMLLICTTFWLYLSVLLSFFQTYRNKFQFFNEQSVIRSTCKTEQFLLCTGCVIRMHILARITSELNVNVSKQIFKWLWLKLHRFLRSYHH